MDVFAQGEFIYETSAYFGLPFQKKVANLSINDDADPRNPFAAYDSEPPPAPKLKSKGVVALDITDQFTHAAQRMS